MLRKLLFAGSLLATTAVLAAERPLVVEGDLELQAQELQQMLENALPQGRLDAVRHNRGSFDNLLQEYVLFKQLEQEAARLGLDQDKKFLAQLELHRLTTLASLVIEEQLKQVPEPNFIQLAQERYKAAAEPFIAPEQVHAEHILIAIDEATADQEALAKALEVREQAVAQPRQFQALAQQYSDDPGVAVNKGDLGFFSADKMVKPFSEAAFAMEPGQISEPVRSQFGYHIIRLIERKPGKTLAFRDVRSKLVNEERKAFYARERAKLLAAYKERESLVYDQEAIDAFYADFAAKAK